MTTHALRYHDKFLGHMTEDEASALIERHIEEGADRNYFDVHEREQFEILVRGNLVDTSNDAEEAAQKAEALRANLRPHRRGHPIEADAVTVVAHQQ